MSSKDFPDFPIDDIGELLDDGDVNVADGDTGTDDIAHLLDDPLDDGDVGEGQDESDDLFLDDDTEEPEEPEGPQDEFQGEPEVNTPEGDDSPSEPVYGDSLEDEPSEGNPEDDFPEDDDLFADDEPPSPGEEWERSTNSEFAEYGDIDDLNGDSIIISPKDAEIGDPEPLFSGEDGKSIVKIDYSEELDDDDYSLDGDLLDSEIPEDNYRVGIFNTENTSKPLLESIREENEERNTSLGDTIPAEKIPGKPYVPVIIPDSKVREIANDRYSSKELSYSASRRSWVSSMTLVALVLSLFAITLGFIFHFINGSDEVTYEVNSTSMQLSSVTYSTQDGDVLSNDELAPFSTTVKVGSGDVSTISAISRNVAGEAPMISCTITRNGESTTSIGMGGVTCNL